MEKLNVFVSSTCYDLNQIRADLHSYLENNGYNAILSEYINFPVNPSKKTIINCVDAVKNNADILILVVGNRYGSTINTGKSITNTEYLTAKNKGIPIYVFIDKKILSILPVWKQNQTGDFSSIVDDTKIFEFISEVRDDDKIWTFEFDKAQDIISVLKTQMSYLFKESLKVKSKLESTFDELLLKNSSNKALNIILEKKELYELDFFTQTLVDEIQKSEHLMNDYKYKILLSSSTKIFDDQTLLNWLLHRMDIIQNLVQSLNNAINQAFPIYFGEPGTPSDLKGLYYISYTYARIFENIIKWTIETISTSVDEEREDLKNKFSKLSESLIKQVWDFPFEQRLYIDKLKLEILNGKKVEQINVTITINIDQNDCLEFEKEFESFKYQLLNQ